MNNGELLKEACQAAYDSFDKLKSEEYIDIQSKLLYCIGSYEFDKNPEGLLEYGKIALGMLKDIKSKQPRKVTKKVIDTLEKSLQD